MLVTTQWFFFLKTRLKILKEDWNQLQISVFEKRALHQSYKVLDQKSLEQRFLPKLTFSGSDLNNNHS